MIAFADAVRSLKAVLRDGVGWWRIRFRRRSARGPAELRQALATTGGAVVLCSWTTIVGYGSLLLSANAGIRSFGAVAILGEATCLLAALTLAPALLALMTPRASSGVSRHPRSSWRASNSQPSTDASRCNWPESKGSRKLIAKEGNNPTGAALRGADQ
jgi:hypothetical protein